MTDYVCGVTFVIYRTTQPRHTRVNSKAYINSDDLRRVYQDDDNDYDYQDLSDVNISHDLHSEELGKMRDLSSSN